MMRLRVAFTAFLLFAASGCGDDIATKPTPAPPSALYVLNGLGQTLSRIDLETNRVENNVRTLGATPNAILFDPVSDRLFAANSGDNTVVSLQPDSLEQNGAYFLGPNSNPYDLAMTSTGELAVSGWLSGDVAFFSVTNGNLTRRVPVGRTPEALLTLPGKTLVTLVNYDFPTASYGPGEVVSIADGTTTAGARVNVGLNPQDLLLGPDGLIHVVCTGNYTSVAGRIFFLNATTLAVVDSMDLGATPSQAILVGTDVYVSAYFGGLLKYDGMTHSVLRGPDDPVLAAPGLGGLAWDETERRLYVAGFEDDLVFVMDVTADTLTGVFEVGDGPLDLELVTRP